ncbi:MAG: haloacid dehalogenase type II [Acidobacteria bacterium]|nr:MAG: haloacid dehalogenase type II [Acidobacteriota bacterium]
MTSRRSFVGSVLGSAALAALGGRAAGAQQAGRGTPRRHILVLDVIETMLDIKALEPHFARAFGDGRVLQEWFSNLLLYANVSTVAGPYADFATLAGAVLDMTAAAHGKTLAADDRTRILQGTLSLPAHPDVRDGLQRLKNAGFRMVTLTNSAPNSVAQQLKNAALTDFFERAFSVDAVKKYKPAPEPYQYVARELGVATSDLRMIAAHAWDVHGAMRAGCAATFIARPGHALFPPGPKPDIVVSDLRVAADRIVATEPR